MKLCSERYEEIDKEVIKMFDKITIKSFPVDCIDICKQLGYKTFTYSELKGTAREALIDVSKDGCSCLVELKKGVFEYWIFYNDEICRERIRFTIFHEIGHIILGHTEESDLAESEANHFAAYAIAPPPLVHQMNVEDYIDIAEIFDISGESAYYSMIRYNNWLKYGSRDYLEHEERIIQLFEPFMKNEFTRGECCL
jgi:hypothetical protein